MFTYLNRLNIYINLKNSSILYIWIKCANTSNRSRNRFLNYFKNIFWLVRQIFERSAWQRNLLNIYIQDVQNFEGHPLRCESRFFIKKLAEFFKDHFNPSTNLSSFIKNGKKHLAAFPCEIIYVSMNIFYMWKKRVPLSVPSLDFTFR